MRNKLPKGTLDRLWSDPDNWLPLGIYNCKEDPRVFVPKRIRGLGWTINCANNLVWIALPALLSPMLLVVYLKRISSPAAIIFPCLWLVLLFIFCRAMAASERYEGDE